MSYDCNLDCWSVTSYIRASCRKIEAFKSLNHQRGMDNPGERCNWTSEGLQAESTQSIGRLDGVECHALDICQGPTDQGDCPEGISCDFPWIIRFQCPPS